MKKKNALNQTVHIQQITATDFKMWNTEGRFMTVKLTHKERINYLENYSNLKQ